MNGLIVDLFAGGGGASLGIRRALGREPDIAVNHSAIAIACHARNHPKTRHLTANVWEVDPIETTGGRDVDLLWASPDCRHFSRAKGGKPVSKRVRSLAWVVTRWARATRPRVIALENVAEFQTWGPLRDGAPIKERAGETFRRWVGQLRRLGYDIEWRVLNAADYGAPTTRRRLFLIARRDGRPIVWPEPSHADPRREPTLFDADRAPWRAAAECIDWSDLGASIFERKKPLADATLRRIARGIVRFVLQSPKPFLVTCNHSGEHFRGQAIDAPVQTICAAHDARGLVTPFIARYHGEKAADEVRADSLADPLPTQTTENRFGLVTPFVTKFRQNSIGCPATDPLPTVTAGGDMKRPAGAAHAMGIVAPLVAPNMANNLPRSAGEPMPTVTGGGRNMLASAFVVRNFGGMVGCDARSPLPTITATDHHSLCIADLDGTHAREIAAFLRRYAGAKVGDVVELEVAGVTHAITDIRLRMLQPRELARAQGFPDSYRIDGCKHDQVRLIGNSVVPQVAEAVIRANVTAGSAMKEAVAS